MNGISHRQYKILSDHMEIYDFLIEIYAKDWCNGVPAPFLEYALSSSWMSLAYTHRYRIWSDKGRIVAFCFSENPVTDAYFSLRPGYEFLAEEMIEYASKHLPNMNNEQRFVLFGNQTALINSAKKLGFEKCDSYFGLIHEFDKDLCYRLPKGFRFVEQGSMSVEKSNECCWKGFDHEAKEGTWNGDAEHDYHLLQAPHATPEYEVAIENENGEYVCFAGMWWTPQNNLAYMEPLCTVPKYRKIGLAAAALSEMYRIMKPLGASHMTGGSNLFYERIGFKPMIEFTYWKKP